MDYWSGYMNWPLAADWKCEFCGHRGLTWGMIHAECRCAKCHMVYKMRDEEGEVIDMPQCRLKDEYHEAFKAIWNNSETPLDQVTDDVWDSHIPEGESDE